MNSRAGKQAVIRMCVALVLPFVFFSSCRKGEDDPGFSFRTRKARLAGEWRFISGSVTLSFVDHTQGARTNFVYSLSNMRYDLAVTGPGFPTLYKGTYQLNLNVKKDGTFDFSEISDEPVAGRGSWDFLLKSGDRKNKEEVNFVISDITTGASNSWSLFNWNGTSMRYRIKELRDKKLVLTASYDVVSSAGLQDYFYAAELVFIQ
jgi:hypothetical protein